MLISNVHIVIVFVGIKPNILQILLFIIFLHKDLIHLIARGDQMGTYQYGAIQVCKEIKITSPNRSGVTFHYQIRFTVFSVQSLRQKPCCKLFFKQLTVTALMPEISIFLRIQENAKKKGQSNLISCRTYLTLRLGETEKGKLFPSKKSLDNR